MDRIFWNPDLILLSTFLIFIPLLSILKKTNDKFTTFFLFLGAFLSYQAHFSGLLVVALFILSIFYLKESLKFIIPVLAGLVLSLLPTIVFDLKNDFTNFKGLWSLITDKGDFGLLPFLSNILYNTYEMIQTLGKIFFFWNIAETTLSFGLLVILISLVYFWDKKDFKLVFLWIIGIIVSYSFYDGTNPHYYFLIAVAPLFYIIFGLLTKVKTKFLKFLVAFFILNSTLINLNYYKNSTGVTKGNIAKIYNFLKERSVKDVKYHLDQELKIGFQYTLFKLDLETDGEIYHISYPDELSSDGLEKVSNLGIWVEKKPND